MIFSKQTLIHLGKYLFTDSKRWIRIKIKVITISVIIPSIFYFLFSKTEMANKEFCSNGDVTFREVADLYNVKNSFFISKNYENPELGLEERCYNYETLSKFIERTEVSCLDSDDVFNGECLKKDLSAKYLFSNDKTSLLREVKDYSFVWIIFSFSLYLLLSFLYRENNTKITSDDITRRTFEKKPKN